MPDAKEIYLVEVRDFTLSGQLTNTTVLASFITMSDAIEFRDFLEMSMASEHRDYHSARVGEYNLKYMVGEFFDNPNVRSVVYDMLNSCNRHEFCIVPVQIFPIGWRV